MHEQDTQRAPSLTQSLSLLWPNCLSNSHLHEAVEGLALTVRCARHFPPWLASPLDLGWRRHARRKMSL